MRNALFSCENSGQARSASFRLFGFGFFNYGIAPAYYFQSRQHSLHPFSSPHPPSVKTIKSPPSRLPQESASIGAIQTIYLTANRASVMIARHEMAITSDDRREKKDRRPSGQRPEERTPGTTFEIDAWLFHDEDQVAGWQGQVRS